MNFFEYSKAKNSAPVAGNVLMSVGVSPLYRARKPSFLTRLAVVWYVDSWTPVLIWKRL